MFLFNACQNEWSEGSEDKCYRPEVSFHVSYYRNIIQLTFASFSLPSIAENAVTNVVTSRMI